MDTKRVADKGTPEPWELEARCDTLHGYVGILRVQAALVGDPPPHNRVHWADWGQTVAWLLGQGTTVEDIARALDGVARSIVRDLLATAHEPRSFVGPIAEVVAGREGGIAEFAAGMRRLADAIEAVGDGAPSAPGPRAPSVGAAR